MKPGCRPSEHAIVYVADIQSPTLLDGEFGITKRPIGVRFADSVEAKPMHVASRINFGRVYPIQYNVKVKEDLGMVAMEDMERLLEYYRVERHNRDKQTR
jgi:hypothetical protein